ncbi:FCD domain-containing protein [Xylophilus rhododendri]|uniref:FCD domain-containing protein n=1 Tax=Xylophilus rhododendri TaxID=2697032 RepID=A0A857J3W5_9BURK|nr:FCD domain-containing protein [Xylophilus rhododendri]QHI97555.1 FCD domain-containing protein [Xylophilus rhododendri]
MTDALPQDRPARGSLADRVYAGVLDAILRGEAAESGKLPTEGDLALRFNVSRPTVREALARLRSDGVIASRRGSGSHVIRPPGAPSAAVTPIRSIADIERYYAFRCCVESGAAAAAAEFRDQRDLDSIRQALEALSSTASGGPSEIERDIEFHLAIARASHNPFFVATLETSVAPIRQLMELPRSFDDDGEDRARQVQAEHLAIVEAIERQSQGDAVEATKAHVMNAKRRIFEGTQL